MCPGLDYRPPLRLENKEELDEETLAKAAEAPGVTPDVIQSLEPNKGNYFNTFNGEYSSFNQGSILNFNPVDKITELYERIVESEKQKVELLKEQLRIELDKKESQ